MFTKLILDNFQSFEHVELDLTDKKGFPKRFVFIYGENGSGKTNLVKAFQFLKELTMASSDKRIFLDQYLQKHVKNLKNVTKDEILKAIEDFEDSYINEKVKSYRTVGSKKGLRVSYGFYVKGKHGYYEIEFDVKNNLTKEALYYQNGEGSHSTIFEISKKHVHMDFIKDNDYINEIDRLVERYWGKRTLLAIMVEQRAQNNTKFMSERLSVDFIDFLEFVYNYSSFCRNRGVNIGFTALDKEVLASIEDGRVDSKDRKELNAIEGALDSYFTGLYSDIKRVYYKKKNRGNGIDYELYLEKLIAGEVREIRFSDESTGTRRLLEIFPLIYTFMLGETVIYDEIDNGVHDILMEYVIRSIRESGKGQLIATTHNTLLMESLDSSEVYIIQADSKANKRIVPISSMERVQQNHSMRRRYMNGLYGGTPVPGYFDMDDIVEAAESEMREG